jgi:hypothetical protein
MEAALARWSAQPTTAKQAFLGGVNGPRDISSEFLGAFASELERRNAD